MNPIDILISNFSTTNTSFLNPTYCGKFIKQLIKLPFEHLESSNLSPKEQVWVRGIITWREVSVTQVFLNPNTRKIVLELDKRITVLEDDCIDVGFVCDCILQGLSLDIMEEALQADYPALFAFKLAEYHHKYGKNYIEELNYIKDDNSCYNLLCWLIKGENDTPYLRNFISKFPISEAYKIHDLCKAGIPPRDLLAHSGDTRSLIAFKKICDTFKLPYKDYFNELVNIPIENLTQSVNHMPQLVPLINAMHILDSKIFSEQIIRKIISQFDNYYEMLRYSNLNININNLRNIFAILLVIHYLDNPEPEVLKEIHLYINNCKTITPVAEILAYVKHNTKEFISYLNLNLKTEGINAYETLLDTLKDTISPEDFKAYRKTVDWKLVSIANNVQP